MVDGVTWQGFAVDGNLNITKNQPRSDKLFEKGRLLAPFP
jgi:hypothetical protein